MSSIPTAQTQANSVAGTFLELKAVGDITGRFVVHRYQRGFRWGKVEVERLIQDIWENGNNPYCLQPIVVKRCAAEKWELIDGQQRLTTLYLIFLFMQRAGLQSVGARYTITYETRPESEAYLEQLDVARSGTNIDFFHLYSAFECIRAWFDAHGPKRQHVANKFYGYLFDSVRVIWYEASPEIDSTTLFTRLNVGRIPLTDAELVKAVLLSRSRVRGEGIDRAQELAAQWDNIERDLRDPDVWAFVTHTKQDDCPTRMTLLLDTIAGGPQGRERLRFHTFDTLRQMIDNDPPHNMWNQVIDLHSLVLGWFEDRNIYHKIGYLVAVHHSFSELVALARDRTKRDFDALLDGLIRDALDLSPSGVSELSYDTDAHKVKCERLLLLMNLETISRTKSSTERFSFRLHSAEAWSLEHIHAQNAESLTKEEQWKEWLRLHVEALATLPDIDEERRDELIIRINSARNGVGRETFYDLAREVTGIFTLADDASRPSMYSMHSVTNLALLASGDNSALGNAVFEVKRRRILELDREGAYIPVCTRHVFLKYYTDAPSQQIHFWSAQDRESYLDAMISPENGVVYKYLNLEERPE